MNEAEIRKFAPRIRRWQKEPWVFGAEVLGIQDFDPTQIKILQAFADPNVQKIAVKASTGTGKSFIDAVMVLNFISCYGEEKLHHPKGLLTSIDGPNMQANLWAEISRLYNASNYLKGLFTMQSDKIFFKKYPQTWFVERRTWDKKADSATHQDALGLAGHHAKYSLYMVDESGGVPKGVVSAGERTLVNIEPGGFRKLIQTGNPTHREGPLWDAFNLEKKLWTTFSMTGDPDDPNHSTRIDLKWCRDLIETYGRDYPYVQVYVLGEFPSQDFTSFLGLEDCEAAMSRDCGLEVYGGIAGRLGIDVSYGGEDKSFMTCRQGLKIFDVEEIKVPLSSDTLGFDMANIALSKFKLLDLEDIYVDATGGYAYALMEALRHQGQNSIGLKFNQKSSNPAFNNLRTEMYWNMSRWVKKGGCLPNIPGLAEELCATRYVMHKDKMCAEDKEFVKKRLKRSPDKADSVVTTFATPDRASKKIPVSGAIGGNIPVIGFSDTNGVNGYRQAPTRRNTQVQGFGGGYGK